MSAAKNRLNPRLKDFFRTKSPSMQALLDTVGKILDHDVNLLLLGESGTGKDFLAEAIHACGNRRQKPFVRIDCPSIPADLFEAELFGFEKGTFTDAQSRKLGKLELVRGGTVYFDDIASLSPGLQAKLLRAIEEKSFTRLGGNQTVTLEGRVISSSSVPAEELLSGLRRDLFYRINVVTLTLPPLRERPQDIPQLARSFLARRRSAIEPAAMRMLVEHRWPGNVRELRNVIDRAVLVEESDVITPSSLPPLTSDFAEAAVRQQWTIEDLEWRYIREVLRKTKNYSKAAQILGINRKTLLEKRKRYGI
ncbi:MAG: two-component system, NtrC family, response regulator AtoC [Thermoanaerobaculia bacterium]|jgi:transcriptional regulator with PAS, ATPase and Fis domain|nr:two-component system, NtrC family, response regulator AtoC [Thermoanaerobaculia bacterium]